MERVNEKLYQANIDLVDKNKKLENEIEKLKEDLEYNDHCEEQMRKTITNLEYKITILEEEIKELKQRLEVEIDISDGMLKTIDRAKELMNKYRYTKVEEYWKIIEFFKKLENILKGSEKE